MEAKQNKQASTLEKAHQDQATNNDHPGNFLQDGEIQYPSGWKLALIFVALCLTNFLVALDQTIIATAIPTITSQFHSIQDIGWYGSAYLLTTCSFQLFFGKLYTLLSIKWTFVAAVLIFEVGSTICGASPNSVALIVGRAIAGIGGSGIFSGALIIIAKSVPLANRPAFTGVIGAVWGVASVAGPLLGGAFTSWSYLSYPESIVVVNLPIGAVAIPFIVLFLSTPRQHNPKRSSWMGMAQQFDPIGTVLFIAAIVCLLIALQWGGSKYEFRSGREIALLTVFGVLMVAWGFTQWKMGENATVPLRIARQPTVAFATFYILLGSAAFVLPIYYLPIWFQGIKGDTASESGIHNLPLVLSVVGFAIGGGLGVTLVGYYTPFMIAGALIMSVGAGLLLLFRVDIPVSMWLGFQIIFGAGAGLGLELPNIAVQTVLSEKDVSIGTSLIVLARSLGGAIFVSAGQNVFNDHIISGMTNKVPEIDYPIVLQSGATELQGTIRQIASGHADVVSRVLEVYNDAVVQTFVVALVLACMSIIGAIGVEWRSIKNKPKNQKSNEVA
ncbi:hypothetical protein QQS21_010175 [Conoideocrella luteorostrata]|uniref:Major facilitator superfamily (MFS) profile domain-containing protein n=1 Tax=Conoideocrella luteorostrata TaxID=1105319 RepID=A0AAJ0FPN8_9HYPO|nr:hypothetical protein QQS21_010175 [Conoideocrella luteorostrata]